MKKTRAIFPFLLSLLLMFTMGITAFAADDALPPDMLDATESQVESLEEAIPMDGDIASDEELESVIDITPADKEETAPSAAAEDKEVQQTNEETRSSNAPYLIGAVIAVAAFIGVAIFCKFKGNR